MAPEIRNGALWYQGGFEIDCDGSPRAYSPNNTGLDYLANAGHPGNWYGIVTNSLGVPVIQKDTDPEPGYYISTTALADHSKKFDDPTRYVDSEKVPYISIAGDLVSKYPVGSLGMVLYNGKMCGAIVADVGPHGKYGEGSVYLANYLGIDPSPKRGGVSSGVTWIVFPNTKCSWPQTNEAIANMTARLYNDWVTGAPVCG